MRKVLKIFCLVVIGCVALAVVIIFIPSVLNLFSHDTALPDDRDLVLSKAVVPDAENSYFDLLKLKDGIKGKELDLFNDALQGKWREEEIKEIIAQNKEALAIFDVAANKSQFQDPAIDEPSKILPEAKFLPLGGVRSAGRIAFLRALYDARHGQEREALKEVLNILKVGQQLQNAPIPNFPEYLVGRAVENIGFEAAQRIVSMTKLPSAFLVSFNKQLESFSASQEGLKRLFRSNYSAEVNNIDQITQGIIVSLSEEMPENKNFIAQRIKERGFYFQPNATKVLSANNARKQIQDTEMPCALIKYNEESVSSNSFLHVLRVAKLYVTPNAIGKLLDGVLHGPLTSVQNNRCEGELLAVSTRTLFALRAYKLDKQNLPEMLTMLVPKYLSAIPMDPFDGNMLRYSREKKIIYSVGREGRDLGGSSGSDWHTMTNPTFSIPF